MTRTSFFALLVLLAAGCATNSSVKEQIESAVGSARRRGATELGHGGEARGLEPEARHAGGRHPGSRKNMAESTTAAQKAQQAAADAQAAADRAETAADKAAKAFELRQRKGAR